MPANKFSTKIFADGADFEGIVSLAENPMISGFTTNPTLMRQAGVTDYESFARKVLGAISDLPISFEVFADEDDEIYRQARILASWGNNVYVKVPVTTTAGRPLAALAGKLAREGVKVNVTAVFTDQQVSDVIAELPSDVPAFLSLFAGRIADAGVDPVPAVRRTVEALEARPNVELIWASPREVLNLVQADQAGCHVITMTPDLLKKVGVIGTDLSQFSLDTVRMFHSDAAAAGFAL